ncbi:glycine--tRNA ligase [Planctomycetales bacterium]|nr:glycine--tRNA ligase [Planctomycetales bacterium]GHT06313.1 glycine--tRNA ligase [Planctomycetales bacterium]
MPTDTMKKIVSLAKRRGFVFQSSEIYGGLKACYDYGPLGVELKRNVKNAWWRDVVTKRADVVGLDCSIIMHPDVWKTSGHLAGFSDPLVDCKNCKERFRADHAPRATAGAECIYREGGKSDGKKLKGVVGAQGYVCPVCGAGDLSDERQFNLMFRTNLGAVDYLQEISAQIGEIAALDGAARMAKLHEIVGKSAVYLRPETAQGMFVNFKNVLDSARMKPPFGIAQQGKSYRNEITTANLTFRTCEFEQMELEFFVEPGTDDEWFDYWQKTRRDWYIGLGITPEKLRLRAHEKKELAHYAKACSDVEYFFPFENAAGEGEWGELEGIANRTDYDLSKHAAATGKDLSYFETETKKRYTPYVIEPAAGADRATLAFLCDAYREEKVADKGNEDDFRTVLKLHPRLAPIKAAVFPLVKKDGMPEKAAAIVAALQDAGIAALYDHAGAVGRRYRRMDEVGTPFCLTVDGDTLEKGTITVRDRDTMQQEIIAVHEAAAYVAERVK